MKLILTQVVEGLGNPGDIVSVKDGFGRNYLIPRRLGVAWTKGGQKQVDQIKRARSARSVREPIDYLVLLQLQTSLRQFKMQVVQSWIVVLLL
jgi:ribosomal protein L9